MMHGMGAKRDPPTLLHLAYLSPGQRHSCLLFRCNRCGHSQHLTYRPEKSFTLRNRPGIAQTSIDCLAHQVSLPWLAQVIGTFLNSHLAHLCATCQPFALLPPE